MTLTFHAQVRSSQRSVPRQVMLAIYHVGTCRNVRGGVRSFTLDRASLELARDEFAKGFCGDLARYVGAYVIAGEDGQLITVARGKCRPRF